ncbi:MAG: YigZ family protein [Clostridia bacterium]|nr:YigZ family protein [Clostridia bacterium]
MSNEEYVTLASSAQDEFVEKRSRFIGYARPVKSEEEALEFIAQIKKQHWDAKHNVYAYSLRDGQIRRYSDDGEPQGTAGIPVLDVLQKSGITDAAIVVTRYFGGILLGGGGLVRAYGHAASIAVKAAGAEKRILCDDVELTCDYGQYGRVQPLVVSYGGVIEDTIYEDDVTLRFYMPKDTIDGLNKLLADATAGTVAASVVGVRYRSFLQKT